MDIDIGFLKQAVNARLDVGDWLANRPKVGLDVTDVATLCDGFDYLARIIKDITGEDLVSQQVGHKSVEVTFLELDQ